MLHTMVYRRGCIKRPRPCIGLKMAAELKDYIAKCDVCLMHRASQGKEPFMHHEFSRHPWSKIGADQCELDGCSLLVYSS